MGGRGTSSKRRVSRAKTSNGNLKYKGKIEATNYTGFARRYLSKYEEATGKSDTVAYKVGHAYYKLNSAVRKLNRDNAKLHGIKPTKDREFSTYALSWLKDSGLKDYAEKTGDSEANLREIRNRKVRLANKKAMTMPQFKELQIKELEKAYRSTKNAMFSRPSDAKRIAVQIEMAKKSPTGDVFSRNEKANLARFEKNGGRYDRWE